VTVTSAGTGLERLERQLRARRLGIHDEGTRGPWRCPAHQDRRPSLSVSQGKDGAVLHCQAGCKTDAVLAALDLSPRDLFDGPKAATTDSRRIVRTYDYTDASGTLLFQAIRYDPKDFRQRRPDGNGGWTYSLNGTRRVLYRLPEIVAGVDEGRRIFVVEGEKDADALIAAGEVATCCPMGAGKWRDEFDTYLAGADVVIVADDDEPGRRHAADVYRHLEPVAASVTIAQAKIGKDAADHLGAGFAPEDFEVITDEVITDQPVPSPPVTVASQADDLFKRWTMAELLAEPDVFAWLVKGLLAEPTYGQIAGEMKALKTYLAGFLQVSVASGAPMFGQFVPPAPRPVLAYVGEGGRTPYKRRLRRIAEAMGVDLASIPLHLVTDVAPVQSPVFQESLARDLAEVQPALVTVDPFYAYHGIKTSASNLHEEGALLGSMAQPCTDAGASLMVVNHLNQTGSGLNLKRITMAGSGEWVDSWVLVAHREDPDVDAGQFHLTMQIGSRQWGGTSWDLDLSIGHFDQDTGAHDGDITWDIRRSSGGASPKENATDRKVDDARRAILEALADCPWKYTKTELRDLVGGSRRVFDSAFDALADTERIHHQMTGRAEAGTTKKRPLWAVNANPDHPTGPSWREGGE
jgi:5S rRNA maturation endonuclease (ribonuclease M5)